MQSCHAHRINCQLEQTENCLGLSIGEVPFGGLKTNNQPKNNRDI